MNLILDFGNTRIKAATFKEGEILSLKTYTNASELQSEIHLFDQIQFIIISSVTQAHLPFLELFKSKSPLLFTSQTKIPLFNSYQSISTLGSDRIAASIGAFTFFPNQNVLTIDAGTCIKYNFVNAQNNFIGGAISPGIEMRLKAMNHFTSALPLIPIDYNYDKLTGTNTNESLLSGALIGAVSEVECIIQRYLNSYEKVQIVLCGGDSDYLGKQLKNRFFVNPNLVLYGLNKVLNFNIEK